MRPPIWDLFLSISCTFYLKTGCAPPHLWQNSAPPFWKSWIRHWVELAPCDLTCFIPAGYCDKEIHFDIKPSTNPFDGHDVLLSPGSCDCACCRICLRWCLHWLMQFCLMSSFFTRRGYKVLSRCWCLHLLISLWHIHLHTCLWYNRSESVNIVGIITFQFSSFHYIWSVYAFRLYSFDRPVSTASCVGSQPFSTCTKEVFQSEILSFQMLWTACGQLTFAKIDLCFIYVSFNSICHVT